MKVVQQCASRTPIWLCAIHAFQLSPGIAALRPSKRTLAKLATSRCAMDAPYVQSLRVDGKPSDGSWLPASVLQKGGTLEFELGRAKNTQWGTATLPPSYGPN